MALLVKLKYTDFTAAKQVVFETATLLIKFYRILAESCGTRAIDDRLPDTTQEQEFSYTVAYFADLRGSWSRDVGPLLHPGLPQAALSVCRPQRREHASRAEKLPVRPEGRPPCASTHQAPCRTTADASRPVTPPTVTEIAHAVRTSVQLKTISPQLQTENKCLFSVISMIHSTVCNRLSHTAN